MREGGGMGVGGGVPNGARSSHPEIYTLRGINKFCVGGVGGATQR
jgi:hypothetical protein